MSAPDPSATPAPARSDAPLSPLLRAAIWVAIGALIAAAVVCVIWVLLGSQNGLVGRAFLTILLLAGFAGVAILDAHLAPQRPAWFALASLASWIVALLLGAAMIWMPDRYPWLGFSRFVQFLLIVLILQLVLLHVRLYTKALRRYDTPFTRTVAIVTIALLIGLATLVIIPLAFGEWLNLADLYWRIVVAVAILTAVGTALVPLVNVLFAPRPPRPHPAPAPAPYGAYPAVAAPGGPAVPSAFPAAPGALPVAGAAAASAAPAAPAAPTAPAEPATQELLPWPMYVDGATPLPMLADGSPDWNAYYTGQPSPGAHVFTPIDPTAAATPAAAQAAQTAPAAEAPAQQDAAHAPEPPATPPGFDGFPPPPPLPPRP